MGQQSSSSGTSFPSKEQWSQMDDNQYSQVQKAFSQIEQGSSDLSSQQSQQQVQEGVSTIKETLQQISS